VTGRCSRRAHGCAVSAQAEACDYRFLLGALESKNPFTDVKRFFEIIGLFIRLLPTAATEEATAEKAQAYQDQRRRFRHDRQDNILSVARNAECGTLSAHHAAQVAAQGAGDGGAGVKQRVRAQTKAAESIEREVVKLQHTRADVQQACRDQHLIAARCGSQIKDKRL
jgi:hypothetical protein